MQQSGISTVQTTFNKQVQCYLQFNLFSVDGQGFQKQLCSSLQHGYDALQHKKWITIVQKEDFDHFSHTVLETAVIVVGWASPAVALPSAAAPWEASLEEACLHFTHTQLSRQYGLLTSRTAGHLTAGEQIPTYNL